MRKEGRKRDKDEDKKNMKHVHPPRPSPLPLSPLLPPIDEDATWSGRGHADRTLRLAAKILERTLVVPQESLERVEALAVVLAQPLLLLLAQHVLQDHARLDRHARQPLKAEPSLVSVGVLGMHVAHDQNRFDPNAKVIVFIITRFISKNMATR